MLHKEIVHFKSGIYKITNLVNQKFYIGSSVNLYNRFHTHSTKLKTQVHTSKHLQASYNKYGKDNFIFEVIEYCKKEILVEREQWFLDTLNPQYNKRKDATLNLGVLNSVETRKKISESLKKAFREGRKIGKCVNNIPVTLFDLFGNKIADFESGRKCAIFIGTVGRNLPITIATHSKVKKIAKKYYVLKKEDSHLINQYLNLPKVYNHAIKVKLIDTWFSSFIIFTSIKEMAAFLNIKLDTVHNRIKKKKLILERYFVERII
jgi:group I intron endonuclease